MQDNKESFLDSKSLIAIGFLVLSWLAWDHYMKKKYPPAPKERPAPMKELAEEDKKENFKQTFLSPPHSASKKHREKTLEFQGENMEVIFSSRGFGVKKLKLKGYFNRQKKPVEFHSPETPLFSSSFFKNTEEPIPFKIRRQGDLFIGEFSSSQGNIKKTIRVNDKQFILISQTEFHPKKEGLQGLSLRFSHPKPEQTGAKGFFKIFLIYGQDILKAFASYEGGQTQRLEEKALEQSQSFSNVDVAALGGKYFGKAFINSSSFFPSVTFEKDENKARVQVDYEFLHSKVQKIEYKIFLGPKSLKNFQELGGNMRDWLDFGFFGWLARPLLLFLNWLYSWCHNWGLAIILLTFFVRLCLLPINIKSYKSMKIMQKIQPQIKELKDIHKKDPKKMNLEVMALMKKHKANPLGGCLPLFIQFPVFFALYRVLGESIELYQSPFIFWIKDLSLKDPYYVFPVLGGLILFIQQSITPMNIPKEQARLLKAMPLLFSVFMLGLPSGLTLYIFVSGLFGLVQQFFFVKSSYFKGGEDVKVV